MTTPKLSEAACKGTHLPDDDGSDENFVYGGPENADGPAVRTGAWIADVTYDEPSSAPPFAKPVTFTATVSNSEPVTHAGWGPQTDNLDTFDCSAIVQWASGTAVFDSTGGGGRSTVLLPYIEQHEGEADDGGFVINWTTTGDGPKGGDSVGVIAIITPTEHGGSVLEFSVENFPNNSQSGPGDERLASFCATGQTSGDGSNQDIIIDWTSGDGSSHDAFPTETIIPTETVHPMESVHALYDLVV